MTRRKHHQLTLQMKSANVIYTQQERFHIQDHHKRHW